MSIKGFQKTTFLDFDGQVSSLIFLSGCNFRCKYCHNKALVLSNENLTSFDENFVWDYIKENKEFIDGFVVSGGEPCFDKDLTHYLTVAKVLGLKTKIYTNGSFPNVLKYCLNQGLLDFVSMDIKTSVDQIRYNQTVSRCVNIDLINQSIDILMSFPRQYEFRTTVVKPIIDISDIENISSRISGAEKYIIQNYRLVNDSQDYLKSYNYETLRKMVRVASKHVQSVSTLYGFAGVNYEI